MVLRHPYYKAKVSTDGSDEEMFHPRGTLSFGVPTLSNGPPRCLLSGSKARVKWPLIGEAS